jgi:hypothetical protein
MLLLTWRISHRESASDSEDSEGSLSNASSEHDQELLRSDEEGSGTEGGTERDNGGSITEPASEPIAKPPSNRTTEPITEPPSNRAAEPIAKPPSNRVAASFAEPIAEPASNLTIDPDSIPITEMTRAGRRSKRKDMSGLSLCLCGEGAEPHVAGSIQCQRAGCETVWVSILVSFVTF